MSRLQRNNQARHGVYLRLTEDVGLSDTLADKVAELFPGHLAEQFCKEFDSKSCVAKRKLQPSETPKHRNTETTSEPCGAVELGLLNL